MVDSVAATVKTVIANGGEIVQPIGADAPEITARFLDPGGNVIGLYQQPASRDPFERRAPSETESPPSHAFVCWQDNTGDIFWDDVRREPEHRLSLHLALPIRIKEYEAR